MYALYHSNNTWQFPGKSAYSFLKEVGYILQRQGQLNPRLIHMGVATTQLAIYKRKRETHCTASQLEVYLQQ